MLKLVFLLIKLLFQLAYLSNWIRRLLAQVAALRVNLKEEDWHIQENQHQVGRAQAICVQARNPNYFIDLDKMA